MAQQIVTLAKEETSQDILARVRGLETNIEEVDGNIGEVTASVGGIWIPRYKKSTISGAGTVKLEIPYSESGYEIYYLSGRVECGQDSGTCSNKLTIDGKIIADISAYNSSSSYRPYANIAMRNLSYVPFSGSGYISTDSHIGESTLTTNADNDFNLPFFGRFPFHSLVWEGKNRSTSYATFSIYYLEKAE